LVGHATNSSWHVAAPHRADQRRDSNNARAAVRSRVSKTLVNQS
jgi:hypothetical protein